MILDGVFDAFFGVYREPSPLYFCVKTVDKKTEMRYNMAYNK